MLFNDEFFFAFARKKTSGELRVYFALQVSNPWVELDEIWPKRCDPIFHKQGKLFHIHNFTRL